MIEVWTLPKHERTNLEGHLKQLQANVNARRDEIQKLQNWLDNLNALQAADVDKIRKLLNTYKYEA